MQLRRDCSLKSGPKVGWPVVRVATYWEISVLISNFVRDLG